MRPVAFDLRSGARPAADQSLGLALSHHTSSRLTPLVRAASRRPWRATRAESLPCQNDSANA
jgi:hypothetical protein